MTLTPLEAVTLGIALLGAVLGVLNTWRAFRQDQVRLLVEPEIARFFDGTLWGCVHVVNRSAFDVTIKSVALAMRGSKVRIGFEPLLLGEEYSPVLLKPRAAKTFFLSPVACQDDQFGRVKAIVVGTACGHSVSADNAALRWLVEHRPATGPAAKVTNYDERRHGAVITSPHGPPKGRITYPTS